MAGQRVLVAETVAGARLRAQVVTLRSPQLSPVLLLEEKVLPGPIVRAAIHAFLPFILIPPPRVKLFPPFQDSHMVLFESGHN
jgi:hypothetical protein